MLFRASSIACLLLSAAVLAGCSSADSPTRPAAVRVTATQPVQSLSLPGELESYFQTDITPRAGGYVKQLYANIGSHVRQGQVLADLDAPELTAALNEALSKQKAAEAVWQASRGTYRRLRQTARTAGAVSPLQLDQTRAHYRAAA